MFKIILFFFVASFALLEVTAIQNFTVDQYVGEWYEIGMLIPKDAPFVNARCDWFSIKKDNKGEGYFEETYREYSESGAITIRSGTGRIIDSQIVVSFLGHSARPRSFIVQGYDENKDLILIGKKRKMHSGLISRRYPISSSARAEFERIAEENSARVIYFTHNIDCASHKS